MNSPELIRETYSYSAANAVIKQQNGQPSPVMQAIFFVQKRQKCGKSRKNLLHFRHFFAMLDIKKNSER